MPFKCPECGAQQQDTGSAYGWWEFELEPGPSRYELLNQED